MGTHLHRFFCPTTKQQVCSLAPSWIRDRLDTSNGSLSPVEHCALIRGMVAPTIVPTRPDSDYGTIVWHTWQVIPAGCSLYTDGSLIEARLGSDLEALGWAFAAFDAGGNVVAPAYGVPPRDADTIQGAELWALKPLTFVPFSVVIYVDCKAVVDGVRSGQQWIYSSKRRCHQHWVSIYHALDAGDLAEKVVWVPADICEARIGEVLCGNITRDMWLGNKLVDELAKLGAQSIKAPQDVVRKVVARQRQAQELAVFVGQVNALANAWPGIDGKPQRDSTGMPQGARRGKKRERRASIEAGKDNGGDDVGALGTVELARENVSAWPRPSPTPSLAATRARLREAAARAEAQSEASFSEWWRQSRDLRMSQTPV